MRLELATLPENVERLRRQLEAELRGNGSNSAAIDGQSRLFGVCFSEFALLFEFKTGRALSLDMAEDLMHLALQMIPIFYTVGGIGANEAASLASNFADIASLNSCDHRFYFAAYFFGYNETFVDLCGFASRLRNLFVSKMVWFEFIWWLFLHGREFPTSQSSWKESSHPKRVSRPLSLAEFQDGKMFEDIVEKPAQSLFIFVSHRWLTQNHPDRDGKHKETILGVARKTQRILNHFLDIERLDLSEDDFVPTQAFDLGTEGNLSWFFDAEFRWANDFFQAMQKDVLLWYDYHSIPQEEGNPLIPRCLDEIQLITQTVPMLALVDKGFLSRGWCFFECIESRLTENQRVICFVDGVLSNTINSYILERLQYIYYDFVAQMESRRAPPVQIFQGLGLECTKGSDLEFLADKLFQQCTIPSRGERYWTIVHPYLSAMHRIRMRPEFDWKNWSLFSISLHALTSQIFSRYGAIDDLLPRKPISFQFNFPDTAKNFLAQHKSDWDKEFSVAVAGIEKRLCGYQVRIQEKEASRGADRQHYLRECLEEFQDELDNFRAFIAEEST